VHPGDRTSAVYVPSVGERNPLPGGKAELASASDQRIRSDQSTKTTLLPGEKAERTTISISFASLSVVLFFFIGEKFVSEGEVVGNF